MKTSILCFLTFLIFFGSCTTPEKNTKKEETQNLKSIETKVESDAVVTVWVKGMVCKMGCGGSLRKELMASGGVEKVEVNFIEDQEEQELIVYYQQKLITVSDITTIVQKTNNGQFSARSEKSRKLP